MRPLRAIGEGLFPLAKREMMMMMMMMMMMKMLLLLLLMAMKRVGASANFWCVATRLLARPRARARLASRARGRAPPARVKHDRARVSILPFGTRRFPQVPGRGEEHLVGQLAPARACFSLNK